MSQENPDTVPEANLTPPAQKTANIMIVGNEAVQMLDDIVASLKGTETLKGVDAQKYAVLRMIGIFKAAIGQEILIKEPDKEPLSVPNLWR